MEVRVCGGLRRLKGRLPFSGYDVHDIHIGAFDEFQEGLVEFEGIFIVDVSTLLLVESFDE